MAKRRIEYEIGTSIDTAGIDELKRQLAAIRLDIKSTEGTAKFTKELEVAYEAASELEDILNRSWNSKLGQLDLSKVRKEIDNSFFGMQNLKRSMEMGGAAGAMAFNSFSKAVLNTNVYVKQTSKLLDEMAVSLKNTVKWGITSSLFNNLTGSLQKAWDYSVNLDKSLNDIRIVADKSADEMERFAKNANNAAKNLGASTKDYAQAALIYYQQGDNDAEAQTKADVTLKTANVTGQSGQEVSEQLTAVWNGYKVSAEEAELYIDKLAAVAASTASDLEELATGMSKVASAANIMGVDVDQLNATLATVVSVTRQAPESVGTAFKTIYARMGDIEAGLDAETTLGSYTEQMKEIAGINVLDTNGQLRDMGEVIEEVGAMWGNLSREQQVALSQVMAGTRQYNNLLALFDNWGMYTEALNTSKDSAGELQKQQDIYMESTKAHLQQLSTEAEKTYDILFDTDSVNSMTDALTGLVSVLNGYLSSFGGGLKSITGVALTLANVMSNQIGGELDRVAKNWQQIGQGKDSDKLKASIKETYEKEGHSITDESLQYALESQEKLLEISKSLTEEEQKEYIQRQQEIVQLQERVQAATEYEQIAYRLKDLGMATYEDAVDISTDTFEQAEENISNKIEEMVKMREALSGKGFTPVTKEDIQKDLERATKMYQSEGKDGKKKTGSNNTMRKLKKQLEEYDKAEAKQMSFEEHIRQQELADYKQKLELKQNEAELSKDEADILQVINGYLETNTLTEENRNKLVDYQNQKIDEQRILLDQAKKGAQGLRDAQENTTPEMLDNIEKMKNYQESVYQAKVEQEQLATSVKGLTAIGSILTTLTGSMSVLTDETMSTEDKMKSLFTAGLSVGAMLLANWKSIISMGPGLIVMLNSATVALGGSTAGVTTLTGAIGALWTALTPILPIILAVAAGIALLAVAVVAGVKAWNKDADAMKAANAQMDAAVDRFNKLNEEAKQLKETLEGYNEALKEIENMTTATEGFEEALADANAQAKQLIETYGLYGEGDWSYGDKGQIVISDEAQARIQAQADQKAHTAERQMYGAKIHAGQATLKSQTTDLKRDIGYSAKYYYDDQGNKQYGTTTDAYGDESYYSSEQFTNEDLQAVGDAFNELGEELDLLSDEQLKDTLLAMDDLPDAVRGNIDAIIENRDELEILAQSMSETAAAADFYAKQMMENAIEDKYGDKINKLATTKDASGKEVVNEGRASLITSILANEAQDQSDAMSKELQAIDVSDATSNDKLNDKYGYDVENDEDLARTYAEKVLGYTEAEASKLTYDGGWNKGTLKDKSGEKILDGYSDDYMREELARVAKEEEITKKYKDKLDGQGALDNIGEIIGAGTAAGAKYGTDFTDAFLQSMANGNKKIDLSSSFAELDPNEVESIMGTEDKDIATMLGMGEEDWKAMGYTSSAEFGKAFKEGLTNWEWDRDAAVSSEASKLNLEEYDLDKEELEDYAKHLMNVSDESGELADSLETDAEASAKVAKSVMRMNNGVEELAENFDDWKDVMKKSSKESEEYHEALSGMQNAVADLLDTEEDYVSDDFLQSHFEDIEKAADGDAEAIDRLKQALAEDIIMKVAVSNDVSAEKQEEIKTWLQEIQDMSKDIKIGANIDLENFEGSEQQLMEKMQNIISAAGMTADEASAAFGAMGFQTNFAMEEVPVEQTVPNTITETKILEQKKDFFGNVTYQKVKTNSYQDGVEKFTGKQMQIAMETSKDGKKVPKLASVVKTGTGASNNFSKKNAGGGPPKTSSGGGSKPKQEKHLESELDIYHDVNVELGKISSNLDKVQSSTDQLVGQSRIDNLAEQYALLNAQIDTTAEKIDIARGEMSDLAKDLAGKGIQFDKDGTISNYADAYNSQLAYVNSVIDRYNSMSSDAQEKYQETYDKAKEDFDKFVEDIGRYDELLTDEIPGMQAEIQDAINKQIELKLDAFHQELEIRLDMADAERDWNEFFNKVIKDIDDEDILGNAQGRLQDFMSYYKEDLNGVIQVGTQHIQDILTDLKTMDEDGIAKFYGKDGTNDKNKALEDLKKYYEQLMEDLESIHDLSDEIHESYVDMIGEAQEKFDEQIATFETINNLIEHDKNVISMIYGEESYSALSKFYDKQEENYNKQLDFQKQQVEFWQMQMATAEEGSDAWNAAKENWLSAVETWNGAIETAIQNLQDKYLNAINAIFQNLNNNVTNGMGLDFVETEWDLINQNADQYLDTVNAIYKVQELQNKYLDAIDKTNSPAQQKKLNDLMQQETNYLREQDKLSEYDLERANLKYELALKQMALEEAQQNKTQLRLRRDSQGNYTYQYTQDDDQVASIQSEIADLYNQLYNLDAEQYKGNLEEIYNIWNEFQERMAEAAQINDPEQRAAKELLIKQQYSDLINGLVEKNENLQANLYQSTMSHLFDLYNQNTANYADMSEDQKAILDMFINAETDLTGAAFDNMFDLYNINIEQFKNMTDEQKDILMSSMIPQWDSGVQQMTDKIAGEGGFIPTCKDAFEELDQATEDYMTGLEELQKNADVSFEDVKNGINDVVVETEKLLTNNDELIEKYGKEIGAIQSVIGELENLIKKYGDAKKAAEDATKAAYEYWQQEQNKNAEVDPNLDKPKEEQPAVTNNTPTPTPAPAEPAKPSLAKGSYVEVKSGTRWYADSYGGGGSGIARSGKIAYINTRGSHAYNIGGLGWVRKTDIVGYDTGGYTGEWNNNNGRLAMLHQKELVLNANDTANMLSAITILRDITANLGATLLNKMASISAGSTGSIGQGLAAAGMEQNVVINAEFPNATSSKEIEDALNNLVNRASQHITK